MHEVSPFRMAVERVMAHSLAHWTASTAPPVGANAVNSEVPTRAAALPFAAKATVHRLRRSCKDAVDFQLRRWPVSARSDGYHAWGVSLSQLDLADRENQRRLILGKIENLRVAARTLNGIEVPAGGVFSFWAQVGRPVARRGYVPGRELSEGCIIPSIGGGLCQLSNALYQAALDASLEIVERRPHSQIVEGSAADAGRDATVFWNYVDLRFRDAVGIPVIATPACGLSAQANLTIVAAGDSAALQLALQPYASCVMI